MIFTSLALAGILLPVPAAQAQSAADQYIPSLDPAGNVNPSRIPGSPPPGSGSGASEERAGKPTAKAALPASDSGTSRGGTAPFSDYPLTPFIAGLAALLLAALVVSLVLSRRRRLRSLRAS